MHTVLTIHNIPYSQILAIIFSKKTLICIKFHNRRKKISKKRTYSLYTFLQQTVICNTYQSFISQPNSCNTNPSSNASSQTPSAFKNPFFFIQLSSWYIYIYYKKSQVFSTKSFSHFLCFIKHQTTYPFFQIFNIDT